MSLKQKLSQIVILVTFILSTLAGCGGNLEELAQDILYPTKSANKTPVSATPPEGYLQNTFEVEENLDSEKTSTFVIHSWYKINTDMSRPVVVYFHGNGTNLGSLYESNMLKAFDSLNAHWVVIDYPGYGLSSGTPSMVTINAATDQLMAWVHTEFPHSKIVVWGRSLGAAVAAQAVYRHQNLVSHYILTSPWADMFSLAIDKLGSTAENLPQEWIEKNKWETAKVLSQVTKPVLIHHGTNDKLIPIKFGRTVYNSLPSGVGKIIEVPDRGHNDLFGDSKFWSEIRGFVAQ